MNESNELNSMLEKCLLGFSSDVPVSAEILALEVLNQIDPSEASPALVRWGCNLQLRQMARGILRREYHEADETPNDQGELFDGLQDRYPGTGNNKGFYMPRMRMSKNDWLHNMDRLEKEAKAKIKHRNALEAEFQRLNEAGHFDAINEA